MEKAVLNADIGDVLSFSQNVWSAAYGVVWSTFTKLPSPRAFWSIIAVAVAVVTTPLFTTIIIATRQVVGLSSPGDSLSTSGGLLPIGVRSQKYKRVAKEIICMPCMHVYMQICIRMSAVCWLVHEIFDGDLVVRSEFGLYVFSYVREACID